MIAGAAVTWSSSDASVASVDDSGLVTAVGNGSATVTATSGDVSGSAAVAVAQAPAEVVVTPAEVALTAIGEEAQLSAEVLDGGGQVIAGAAVTWSSSDASVASVDGSGLVTAEGNGSATVTATSGGASGSAAISVAQAPARVTNEPAEVVRAVGDSVRLMARVSDASGHPITDAIVSWSSSNTSVASVDSSGMVTAVAVGSATVTASSGPARGEVPVLVIPITTSVSVAPATDTMTMGDTLRFVATAFDSDGNRISRAIIRWSSSTPEVADVDSLGLVRAVSEGTTWVVARSGTGADSARVTVLHRDRAALEATGGPNWHYSANWLTDAPLNAWHGVTVSGPRVVAIELVGNGLSGSLPPELGDLGGLLQLVLPQNNLTGPIPPQLGSIGRLSVLNLSRNSLTGPIPPSLENLQDLRKLLLSYNNLSGSIPTQLGGLSRLGVLALAHNSLTGPIPPSLENLQDLRELYLFSNNLSGPIPSQLAGLGRLTHLDIQDNSLTGPIPPFLGDQPRLYELFLQRNSFTGPIPPELGKLTRLRYLFVHLNQLTGEIPPELGDLSALEDLRLGTNNLTGPIPASFGRLTSMRSLSLEGNPGLTGPVPMTLTYVKGLWTFATAGTSLCAPSSPDFQSWLRRIPKTSLPLCEEPQLYLTQAVQSRGFPVPLVAGEEALLRFFVTAARQNSVDLPDVRATFFVGGSEVHVANVPARSGPIPTAVDEGDMSKSVNALIPATVIRPGLEMIVEVDPEQKLDPELGVTGRIPESGRMAVDVRSAPPLDLTFIPFLWSNKPDSAIIGLVDGIVGDPNGHHLLSLVRTLLPVADIRASAHDPVVTSSNHAGHLFDEVTVIRAVEGGSGHWVGTMSGSVVGAGGVATTPGWTSFAVPYDWVIAHELGHNMSLRHAPCRTGDPDYHYPYPNGNIGAWGYDFQQAALVSPNTFDLMSYCAPRWISDYSFREAFKHRAGVPARLTGGQPTKALLIWGGVDAAGSPFLEPTFVVEAPPALPESGGEYRVAGRTADGRELFSLRFSMPETADGDGGSSFAFVLPVETSWGDDLANISLSGPTGYFTLDSDTDNPMVIVRNPANGQVRAILRDVPSRGAALASATAGIAPGMRVLLSYGLPDPAAWRR